MPRALDAVEHACLLAVQKAEGFATVTRADYQDAKASLLKAGLIEPTQTPGIVMYRCTKAGHEALK